MCVDAEIDTALVGIFTSPKLLQVVDTLQPLFRITLKNNKKSYFFRGYLSYLMD